MNEELQEKIFNNIKTEWEKRHGADKIDPEKLEAIKQMLKVVPDEDANKRVTDMKTGKTHLVPIEEMILNGLRGDELHKYPEAK